MADKILEKICHKVGVTATEAETKTINYQEDPEYLDAVIK
jgi:hypothetical protein